MYGIGSKREGRQKETGTRKRKQKRGMCGEEETGSELERDGIGGHGGS